MFVLRMNRLPRLALHKTASIDNNSLILGFSNLISASPISYTTVDARGERKASF